ncbi:MAG TPA: hypothetical protein VFU22_09470, partial [Roseiflexaceae bacterium]|nr:hypothetical protein [Roseiflexaceae bacterium]
MDQLANRLAITDMTSSSHACEIGLVNGGQAMEQLDKAARVIVQHQPRQRSFAGAGGFLTEIRVYKGDVLNSKHLSSGKGDSSMTITGKTTMDHVDTASTPAHDHRLRTSASKLGRFLLHLLEMLLAMMIGMPILYMLGNLIPPSSSYAAAFVSGTNLNDLAMVVFMTVPMVAWMIVRGHGWRHSAEMA